MTALVRKWRMEALILGIICSVCVVSLHGDAADKPRGSFIIQGEKTPGWLNVLEISEIKCHQMPLSDVIHQLALKISNIEWNYDRPKLTVSPTIDVNKTLDYEGTKVPMAVFLSAMAERLDLAIVVDEKGIRISEVAKKDGLRGRRKLRFRLDPATPASSGDAPSPDPRFHFPPHAFCATLASA